MNAHYPINLTLVGISRRAETVDRKTLVQTFVDIGPLFAVLSTNDHQIVYGRRGTGKTHALLYLAEQSKLLGNLAVYIDLRNIGSSGGVYGDPGLALPQRATRLLLDVLAAVHEALLQAALDGDLDLSAFGPVLDNLAMATTEVQVVGETTREQKKATDDQVKNGSGLTLTLGTSPSVAGSLDDSATRGFHYESTVGEKGVSQYRVHFGRISSVLRTLADALKPARLLVLLDEWGTVPLDLQPYLADLVRRAFLPVPGITVKIAAIEQRSHFKLGEGPDYVGIEVGADASADVDLDDYMVFDNNSDRAVEFFRELLFRHYQSGKALDHPEFKSAEGLIAATFTQVNAFDDFVKSAEGVPRDAFNILSLAAQRGMDDRISVPTIRVAARTWYQRDKETAIRANPDATRLLHWIIDEVIAHRKARAFLLTANSRHTLIDALVDARLLHVVKRGLSGQEEAGVRYDAYKLDYGCYVDLLATKSAPVGSFSEDDANTKSLDIIVPSDDYRAIRRAVLNLQNFEDSSKSLVSS